MATSTDTRTTVPFNKKYTPGDNTTFSKIAISAVVPGSATVIATEKNHGLFGNLDLITVYDNGTEPFLNFIEYPATVIDGRRFTIPVDSTNFTTLCSNGYIVKRSSVVGPVRKQQNYKDVALSITPALDRYVIIEKEKRDFGIQTEVDISMLGIPREEITTTQIEEVTKYGLNSVIWQTRGWHTWAFENPAWHRSLNTLYTDQLQGLIEKYSPVEYPDLYRGRGVQFLPSESCIELFVELPAESAPYFLGPTIEYYFPGNYPAGYAFQMLETQRSFKYLPGRANVFTFGVKATVDNAYSLESQVVEEAFGYAQELADNLPGNIARWGVGNRTDAYFFELSGNGNQGAGSEVALSVNRYRHYRGDYRTTLKNWAVNSPFKGIINLGSMLGGDQYPDDPFYAVTSRRTKSAAVDPDAPEYTKVFQQNFGVDTVDGKGPSGAVLDTSKVTMYKIEFSWYGAAGARFFAYLNTDNDKAEWICLHEIEGGQVFKEPVLTSPVMQIKYFTLGRAGGRVSLKKYGVSAYIEGSDEGTMIQNTAYSDVLKEVGKEPIPLVGITTTDAIKSSFGELIPNQKIILPSLVNVSTSENCLVEVIWKPTSNLIQGITQGPELVPLQTTHPVITGCILPNHPDARVQVQDGQGEQVWVDEMWGAFNLRALSGNFGISGPAARQALVGARIYDNIQNTAGNRFQFKWWDPTLPHINNPTQDPNGLWGDWSPTQLPPSPGLNDNDKRIRTGIFNTYISAVGDYDPNTGPDDWFKTCVKGDVIWLTSPLSGSFNMNLLNPGTGLGTEAGITGPFIVWNNQNNSGPSQPGTGVPNYGHAFVSVYPYVTGSQFEFNIEILDRQAVSEEIFTGKSDYWVSCNLGLSHEGPRDGRLYGALSPTYEGYLGRYFLRNYVESIFNPNNSQVFIQTSLPHLLSAGETFTWLNGNIGSTIPPNQLASTTRRDIRYTVTQVLSSNMFAINYSSIGAAAGTHGLPSLGWTVFTGAQKIYIRKDSVPEYIPLDCINFFPYPYVPIYNGAAAVRGRENFPIYGLPIDRVSLEPGGGTPMQIYPRGLSNVSLQYPVFDPLGPPDSSGFRPLIKYKEFTYQSKPGQMTFAHASATNTHMTVGFPYPQNKSLDNVNYWNAVIPRKNNTTRMRDSGEPWRLVFVGHKGSSIRDAVIISDYWTADQQTVSPRWRCLSSIRVTQPDFLTGRQLSGTPGLSCVYPPGSDSLRQSPNFVAPANMAGTAAKLDFQSSQPIYHDGFITSGDLNASPPRYSSDMASRLIAAFYVPKGKVLQYDISSYFGLVAEYLSNTLKRKQTQPWNSIYITARTLASAVNPENYNLNDLLATGYNENGQLGISNDFNNKFNLTELNRKYPVVAAGDEHIIVIDENGKAYGAGSNKYGQLGYPVNIPNFEIFTSLPGKYSKAICGNNNTFLLSSDNLQWLVAGENTRGQLGLGNTNNITEFTVLSTEFTSFVPGSAHTFAYQINPSNKKKIWFCTGDNTYGQLGTGTFGGNFTTFQELRFLDPTNNNPTGDPNTTWSYFNWEEIACGSHHTVALSSGPLSSAPITRGVSLSTYQVFSCGLNNDGQLGHGNTNNYHTLTNINTNLGFTRVVARNNHTLLLSSDNRNYSLFAMGNNQYGQLGLNSYSIRNTPQRVLTTNRPLLAFCGGTFNAILCGTSLFTVGDNLYGQLGINSEDDIVSVLYPGYDASISLNNFKDNNFTFNVGQPLPLSGSAIFCELPATITSVVLGKNVTLAKKLNLLPEPFYPKAKVYAGLTWREQ